MDEIHYNLIASNITKNKQDLLQIQTEDKFGAEYRQCEKIWQESALLVPDLNIDVQNGLKTVHNQIAILKIRRMRVVRNSLLLAASIALILLVSILFFDHRNQSVQEEFVVVNIIENQTFVNLDDGSMVYLQKGSKLSVSNHFSKENRKVLLEGNAYFVVSHDPKRPFEIKANNYSIKVLGTEFSVDQWNKKSISVSVAKGLVELKSDDTQKKILVAKSEKGFSKGNDLQKDLLLDKNFDALKTQSLVFYNDSLEYVVKTVEWYFGIKVTSLIPKDLTFTATMHDKTLEEFVKIFEEALGVSFNYTIN